MAGKAPAFQFYVMDFMTDANGLTATSNGIWIRMLCNLHRAPVRGELSTTTTSWCLKCNCTEDELMQFIEENKTEKVADLTFSHGNVTVVSRRMARERKEREHDRIRKAKERSHANVTEESENVTEESENVTPPSSSSSSSSIKKEGERAVAPNVENLIKEARKIKGWNYKTWEQDAEFFDHLLAEHPEDLVKKVLEDLRIYQEEPAKKYKNLHSTLRNWCGQEAQWRGDRGEEDDNGQEEARVDDNGRPMYLLDDEWIDRKEFDRLMAAGELVRTDKVWKRKTTEVAN